MPIEPFSPKSDDLDTSPFDLPRPLESESKKLFDPALPNVKDSPAPKSQPDLPSKPKKLLLVPDQMPDSPDGRPDTPPEAKSTPKDQGAKPIPDRKVFLDPVAPGSSTDLPGRPPEVHEERDSIQQEAKSSPKPDSLPTGLSDFQVVKGKQKVANGHRPTLEGYEWLAKNGYKVVVYAHDPLADVTPVKAVCEAAGLKLVGIPTGPGTIPSATASFDAAVSAPNDGQVYVCDDTGLRAGTLWYAHFRRVDLTNPDAAKVRATALGLGDTDTNSEQKKLWEAVQAHLAK